MVLVVAAVYDNCCKKLLLDCIYDNKWKITIMNNDNKHPSCTKFSHWGNYTLIWNGLIVRIKPVINSQTLPGTKIV